LDAVLVRSSHVTGRTNDLELQLRTLVEHLLRVREDDDVVMTREASFLYRAGHDFGHAYSATDDIVLRW